MRTKARLTSLWIILGVTLLLSLSPSVVDCSTVCSPEFDYDLSNVQLPFSFYGWQPAHPFGTGTYLCPDPNYGPTNASIAFSISTVIKWVAPFAGDFQIRSFSPDVQIRFHGCTSFYSFNYTDHCRLLPRQGQYFKATDQEEFRIVLEGDHTGIESIVTIDRYVFDKRFCLPSFAYITRNGESDHGLPVCVNADSMSAAIGVGIFVGLVLVYFASPGPQLVLLCMIVIAGLLPTFFFLWTFSVGELCGNSSQTCLNSQLGFFNFPDSIQLTIPVLVGLIVIAFVFLAGGLFFNLFRKVKVLDTEDKSVKEIYTFPLWRSCSKDKVIAVSWRWDIENASTYMESPTLDRCLQYCRSKGFRYMMVDVVTLDQKSVRVHAVLQFINNYSSIPVLVGVFERDQRKEYNSRLWTNFEMQKYSRNRSVYVMDDLGVPKSTHLRLVDLLCDISISATFELDRLRVLLLSIPGSQLFLWSSLYQIFLSNRNKTKVEKDVVKELIDFSVILYPLTNTGTYNFIVTRTSWFIVLTIPFWFGFLALPPSPTYFCNSRSSVWGVFYLLLTYVIQSLICLGAFLAFINEGCTEPLASSTRPRCVNDAFVQLICICVFSGFFARFASIMLFNCHLTLRIRRVRKLSENAVNNNQVTQKLVGEDSSNVDILFAEEVK